jgi:quinol monooxygenase YgiN
MERVFAFYRLTHGPEGPRDLLAALHSATTIPAGEPGCRSSSIWCETGPSGAVLLLEEWDSPRAMERHMTSPVFRRLLAVLELSRTPPEIRYVQGSLMRGVDWMTQVLGPRSGDSVDPQDVH